MFRVVILALAAVAAGAAAPAGRVTLSLDGSWDVADGLAPTALPSAYSHRAPVPGLTHLAEPAFPDVDRFDTIEGLQKKVRLKLLPESALVNATGVARQNRNWFWYRTRFRAPARRETAILRVAKAQFGTAVWLNGAPAGEHAGCFTAGYFNLTGAIRWDAENELVVRIGAHPAALPASYPTGTDDEKILWTPGIYDSVSIILCDNPVIESVQVAPRLKSSDIQVQTVLRNYGSAARSVTLSNRVAGGAASTRVSLAAGEEKTVLQTIAIPGAELWSPEHPHLYTLETAAAAAGKGDSLATRFGFREFRFDTATRRAWLNGKPYFLRGSNITLHRFFEDPQAKGLVWDEAWVRKLLADIPKRMHWNSFRFCIGPVPDRWLQIADEAGLLIQNEFFVWKYRPQWDMAEMVRQYREWMRDNWNHPSVAIWDAQNETHADQLSEIIRTVRGGDLSNRPWENGYNLPVGADDPIEDHPYLFSNSKFDPVSLERMTGAKSTNSAHPSGHAAILNEYGWLWLNRDGTPTELTKDVYTNLVGANATPDQRREAYAYYLGGLTEFWRAHRNYAGVLHFVYLTCSYPGVYTSDHRRDLERLELEPHFADYMEQAFRPLGVYLNFWQPRLRGGAPRRFAVAMVNDEPEAARGKLALTLETADGRALARADTAFEVAGLGQQSYNLDLNVPAHTGPCLLKAAAHRDGASGPTLSRRKVELQ